MQEMCIVDMLFQQDSATCRIARAAMKLKKNQFGELLIARFRPVNWPQSISVLFFKLKTKPFAKITHVDHKARPEIKAIYVGQKIKKLQ